MEAELPTELKGGGKGREKRKIGLTTVTNPSVPRGGEDGWMQSRCVTAQLLQLNQS